VVEGKGADGESDSDDDDDAAEDGKGSKANGKKSSSKHPSRLTQARFARAMAELQFLGFVKQSARKADHMARLTWGK
jgi:origin recognition complex subunit 3